MRLDGVTVALQPGTTQVITVNRTRSWHARVTFWRKTAAGWQAVLRSSNGRIGYGGLVVGTKRKQGTGTTPLGTYRLLGSFGTHARATGWDLPYRKIRPGDYWVEDNQSAYYNRYRNKSQGGFRWWLKSGQNTSERLADFPTQYEYAVNTALQPRARCATAAPASSCTSTAAGRPPAVSRCRARSCARRWSDSTRRGCR